MFRTNRPQRGSINPVCCDQWHDRNAPLNDLQDIIMSIHANLLNLQHFQPFAKQRVWAVSDGNKIPIQNDGTPSKVNDPSTWGSLDGILQYCNGHPDCFPAIMLSDQLDLIFLDLDAVIDPKTGRIETWAQEVIDICNSYTERSRGGRGVHIFLSGHPPKLPPHETLRCRPQKRFWNNSGEIELYFTKKVATITGDVIVDCPIRTINEGESLALYRRFFPKEQNRVEQPSQPSSPKMKDEEVIRLTRSSKNGDKFTSLYDQAEWEGSEDRSAMDLALANYLAFYTQDREQIKRLMMSSALLREKWDRSDYLDRTIETALKGLSSSYQPKHNPNGPIPIEITTKVTEEPFPLECFPGVLRQMAQEIHRVTKTPIELCGAAVLSAASIATRNTVKVYEKADLSHFLCFFFMIIAESGERKSSVTKKALEPIYSQQEEDEKKYNSDYMIYEAFEKTAREEEKQLLKTELNSDEKVEKLTLIKKELNSRKPAPYRYITDDFTVSVLSRMMAETGGSFAIVTFEGGNVLDYIRGKGHGTDGSLNDSLLLKATWGDPISRDRIGKNAEGEHLFIKDPACHVAIIVQHDRCREFLADPRLRGSGVIARILPITCTTTIGTRFEEENEPSYDDDIVKVYDECIQSIYKSDEHIEIHFSNEAALARRCYFNEVEREMGKGSSLEDLRDVGSKSPTQVTRIAALFELYKNKSKSNGILISEKTWYEAEAVGRWMLDQAAHLQRTDYDEMVLLIAKQISEKVQKSKLAKEPLFTKSQFHRIFKRDLKKGVGGNFIQDVLDALVSYQWLIELPPAQPRSRAPRYRANQGEG